MKRFTKILMTLTTLLATASMALATNVTLKVVDSQGNAISGVQIGIHKTNCCGAGTFYTDANGEITVDLANYTFQGAGYVFTARYAYSSSAFSKAITSADEGLLIHTFQTEAAVIKVADCSGNAIVGATVSYFISNSGGGSVGTVDGSGIVQKELFPGTYSFTARINNTASQFNVNIATASGVGVDHQFTPVKVNIVHSGTTTVFIPNVGSASIVNSYMFPGTYNFNFGSSFCSFPIDITGCTFEKVINVLKVLDHSGNPIAGATARGGVGANFGTWHVSGSTNASGCLLDMRPLPASGSGYSYEAKVNGTTAVVGPLLTNKYTFNTQLLTLRLETCDGTPLNGGHVRWGNGANYSSTHFIGGNTGSSATGETSAEMFPGTYSFEMGYKATVDFKISHNFPADGATIVFKTTKVTLRYNSSIRYGGAAGQSNHFIKPSMELMPGSTVKFEFSVGGTVVDIPIAGCEISKVMLQVKNESGGKVAGATFKPAAGGWLATLSSTDANGCLFVDFNPAWTKIVAYVGNSGQEQLKVALEANGYLWTTQVLRVNLKNHAGALITDGTGSLLQGGGSWVNLGNFNASGYVDVSTFPVASAKYKASYNCTSQEISGIAVVAGAGVQQTDFQTGQVFGSCITSYQGCGWTTFVDGMELMPGSRTYRYPTQTVAITAGSVTYLACGAKTDFEAGTAFIAYPNPATETVSFLNYEGNFEVYNTTGQLMYSGNAATINIADWQSGLYVVRTQDQVIKFVKK